MGGDPKGGKVCWPSSGGGGGATSTWLEDLLWVDDSNMFVGHQEANINLGTAGVDVTGMVETYNDDPHPWWWKPPVNFDATGQMQIFLIGFAHENVGSTNNHTIRIQGRWHAHGSDMDIAFANTCDHVFQLQNGWIDRIWTSPGYVNFTPDGAYAAGKIIFGREFRLDNESDDFSFNAMKIRYKITL